MTYISRTWKVWRPISRQLGSTWKVWHPISRQLGSTWKVWRPIKTIGQYLEGLAPQTGEFPLKFGCKMTPNKGISLEVWLQNDSSKISSTIFARPWSSFQSSPFSRTSLSGWWKIILTNWEVLKTKLTRSLSLTYSPLFWHVYIYNLQHVVRLWRTEGCRSLNWRKPKQNWKVLKMKFKERTFFKQIDWQRSKDGEFFD